MRVQALEDIFSPQLARLLYVVPVNWEWTEFLGSELSYAAAIADQCQVLCLWTWPSELRLSVKPFHTRVSGMKAWV